MNFNKIYEVTHNLDAPLQPIEDGSPIREANGKAIPTNAMTDYKKQGLSFDQISEKIKEKMEGIVTPLNLYQFIDDETFQADYDNLYSNKVFNTPLGLKAKTGGGQFAKLIDRSRKKLLYSIQNVLEDPTVIIWKPVEIKDREDEKIKAQKQNRPEIWLKGKLIFAKTFEIAEEGIKAINSITILRSEMRVSTSIYEL
jgi:hypothetical protein